MLSEEHNNIIDLIDLSRVREILRQEEAEINRIKDLGLFLFGEDEYQHA